MEYYSAIKNIILSFTGKWMEMEKIMLSEVRKVQKYKGLMFSLICGRHIQGQIYIYIYVSKSGTVRGK
jgi:hypothetical protein